MTPDITQAKQIMNTYPNINIDLSPGIEFLHDISQKPDQWRNFIIKHQDRIIYGTDIGMSTTQQQLNRIWLLRMLLETNETFHTPPTSDKYLTRYTKPFTGLNLPKKTLQRIYQKNYQNQWGKKPKPVNLEYAIKTSEKQETPIITRALKTLL